MEIFKTVWGYLIPIAGGVTVGALVVFIFTILVKTTISKLVTKVLAKYDTKAIVKDTMEEMSESLVDKVVDKIKNVSFTQTIQPIANSEFQKICELLDERAEKHFVEVDGNYYKLLDVMEALANYFDDSIAISTEKKKALKEAIEKARIIEEINDTEKVVESIIEVEEVTQKTEETDKNSTTETTKKVVVER